MFVKVGGGLSGWKPLIQDFSGKMPLIQRPSGKMPLIHIKFAHV